jgi:hypothetical protein
MSERRALTEDRTINADDMVRCPQCQRWFNRNDAWRVAEHRGPPPHPVQNPRTAWADEDEGGPD